MSGKAKYFIDRNFLVSVSPMIFFALSRHCLRSSLFLVLLSSTSFLLLPHISHTLLPHLSLASPSPLPQLLISSFIPSPVLLAYFHSYQKAITKSQATTNYACVAIENSARTYSGRAISISSHASGFICHCSGLCVTLLAALKVSHFTGA